MMKNYLDLGRFLLIYQRFVFLDTEDYLADQLFIRHRVRVRFGDEYVHPEHPYRFIFCTVRRKDKQRFLDALAEMSDKMTILGHPDYDAFCERWRKIFKSVKKRGADTLSDGSRNADRVFVC